MKNSSYVQKVNFHVPQGESPRLLKLYLELTERCNNNCRHCYINLAASDVGAASREMSVERIQTILLEAAFLGCAEVVFTGGEPLLRKDFLDIYTFAQKIGFTVTLFTNATLINKRIATLLKKLPPKGGVRVTMYGMDEESYRRVTRRRRNFYAAREGVRLLRKHNIPFSLEGILLPDNQADNQKLIAWAKEVSFSGKGEPNFIFPFSLRARRDSLGKNRAIKKLRISKKRQIEYLRSRESLIFDEMEKLSARSCLPLGDALFQCGCGRGALCVDAYGFLQPCLLMRHPKIACNLGQNTLQEAMANFSELWKIKTDNPQYLKRCARCFLRRYCDQCPAVSYMETGTFDTPVKYYCDYSHLWARFSGLLRPGEKSWEVKDWRSRLKKFVPVKSERVGKLSK